MINVLKPEGAAGTEFYFKILRKTIDPQQRAEFVTSLFADSEQSALKFLNDFYKFIFLSSKLEVLPISIQEYESKKVVKTKVLSTRGQMLAERHERKAEKERKLREERRKEDALRESAERMLKCHGR